MYVYHRGHNQNYACKACKHRIAVVDIDEIFHEQLKDHLIADNSFENYKEKLNQTLIERVKTLYALYQEAKTLKIKMTA